MGRPVVLSNGQMFVGLNQHGLVHDFYYPYVGLDNLTTTRSECHKIGIWADGKFSWVNDGTWEINVDFETDALISLITMKNKDMSLELQLQDFVDPKTNAFCRHMKIANRSDSQREIRVFMHQVFQISQAGRADTALFVPDGNYLLDYKGRCSLLVYAETSDGAPFDQYAVGNCGIEGKEGTFKDAEDGELSGNAVEHGGVDSVIRLSLRLGANQAKVIDYWIIAANSQLDAEKIHEELKKDSMVPRLRAAREWWNDWMAPAKDKFAVLDSHHRDLAKKSLLVVKAHIDRRGSILASGDSSIFNYGRDYYCYCWPRDGAFAIWPLIRLGFKEEARNFFEFCRDIIHKDGYLMHKYQPDRAIGSTWHPLLHKNRRELAIQEDETAIVIIMLGEYLKLTGDKDFVELLYSTLIRPAAMFMAGFIDEATNLPHASYDLWEEKFLTSSYTVATVYSSLVVAGQFSELFGFPDDAVLWREAARRIESGLPLLFDQDRLAFRKGILLQPEGDLSYDNTLDVSSLYGMMMFGPKSTSEQVRQTANLIEQIMTDKTTSGGTPRYENDWYMRTRHNVLGNPWFICGLWLAQYYKDNDMPEKAEVIMTWTSSKALSSGILSEQVEPETGFQVGVAPLVWSHAEYINTALDLADI
ncbi:glycoside hydrolase family 15 protein [Candidatus Saccharibacteria bacterium]|nr:glycoside hydrolase family 15 protein [Candidatus Saccharibacteria bacterium]